MCPNRGSVNLYTPKIEAEGAYNPREDQYAPLDLPIWAELSKIWIADHQPEVSV